MDRSRPIQSVSRWLGRIMPKKGGCMSDNTDKSKDENDPESPQVEVRVSQAWIRMIRWCQVNLPNGELKIRIVNAQPTDLLEHKRRIRFDKEETIPEIFESI